MNAIPDLVQIHPTDLWRGPCESCTRWYNDNAEKLLFKWWYETQTDRQPYSIDGAMVEYFKNRHKFMCEEKGM